MPEKLSSQLEEYLPREMLKLVRDAGEKANKLEQELYLVGGVVRDMFLRRANFDLDLVVEGDAIKLAQELIKDSQAKLTVHPRFGTAKIRYANFSLDLATARRETYRQPGALPTVQPGMLTDDLCRRDFSINAMALCLTPQRFGELIDLYNGRDDLNQQLIRILHLNSFIDDATRILRALRYEQRLNFELETKTAELLRHDIDMLDTISGDRLRHELELILKENYPERVLKRAEELGILNKLHPSLKGNGWLSERFDYARRLHKQTSLSPLYLCLLIYNLSDTENEQFLSRFNFPKRLAQTMRHTLQLKASLHNLDSPQLKPSDIYQLLRSHTTQAIQANALASQSSIVTRNLQLYLAKLRYIKPLLNGDDLKRMGISTGPQLGQLLDVLHKARLNNEVKTRKQEEKLVSSWNQTL